MNTSFEIEPNQEIRNTVCLFTSTSGNLSVDCNERFLFAVTIVCLLDLLQDLCDELFKGDVLQESCDRDDHVQV